jgi:hypothetical protein
MLLFPYICLTLLNLLTSVLLYSTCHTDYCKNILFNKLQTSVRYKIETRFISKWNMNILQWLYTIVFIHYIQWIREHLYLQSGQTFSQGIFSHRCTIHPTPLRRPPPAFFWFQDNRNRLVPDPFIVSLLAKPVGDEKNRKWAWAALAFPLQTAYSPNRLNPDFRGLPLPPPPSILAAGLY